MSKSRSISVRLWSRVAIDNTDKCWEWQGYRAPRGHGQIGAGGAGSGSRPTHQVAWEFFNGRPVAEGMQINHHCDNPPCCNPKHLYEGSHQDNVDDMKRRGRTATGFRLPHTRLSESDVVDIRRSYERQHEQYFTGSFGQIAMWRSNTEELAAEYGISKGYVQQIVNGRERKNV